MECMCAYRLDLSSILSSEKVLGKWSQNPCKLHGKNPLYWKKILLRGLNPRCCNKQNSEPNTPPPSYSSPVTSFEGCQGDTLDVSGVRLLGRVQEKLGFEPDPTSKVTMLLLNVSLTLKQHASVSQRRISYDNSICCYTEIQAADQTCYLNQSQYTDTQLTSPTSDPITPRA